VNVNALLNYWNVNLKFQGVKYQVNILGQKGLADKSLGILDIGHAENPPVALHPGSVLHW